MDQTERNRVERFRQFRREIRGSQDYLLVGIDIAKEKHHAFFWNGDRKDAFKAIDL